jgi:hypothetical protein
MKRVSIAGAACTLALSLLAYATLHIQTTQADDDNLQMALNYIFFGDVDSTNHPLMKVTIEDRNNCIVSKTVQNRIRTVFYFRKMIPETAAPPSCRSVCRMGESPDITIEGDDTVVIVSDASDKQVEIVRRKIASFPIVGNPDRMIKALQYVFSQCPSEQSKTPF